MRTVTRLPDGNILIHIDHQIKKISSQKRVLVPYTDRATQSARDVIKAITRGLCWKEALEYGAYPSLKALAAKERMDKAYCYRVLNLSLLSPMIIEKIIDGELPTEISIAKLFQVAREPLWQKQHELLGIN